MMSLHDSTKWVALHPNATIHIIIEVRNEKRIENLKSFKCSSCAHSLKAEKRIQLTDSLKSHRWHYLYFSCPLLTDTVDRLNSIGNAYLWANLIVFSCFCASSHIIVCKPIHCCHLSLLDSIFVWSLNCSKVSDTCEKSLCMLLPCLYSAQIQVPEWINIKHSVNEETDRERENEGKTQIYNSEWE